MRLAHAASVDGLGHSLRSELRLVPSISGAFFETRRVLTVDLGEIRLVDRPARRANNPVLGDRGSRGGRGPVLDRLRA
ncbi:MAG: hypothetical protein D6695_00795 [Planctomycetota bacterium]|nr:MAG: hypothetical protein D6695_00795 [Planctomycetota bacterium]